MAQQMVKTFFVVIFLRSLFQLLLGLILSSKTTPFDSQKVDSVFVFAIDLEQPRFDINPRFDLIFDPKMTPKFAQNLLKTDPKTCSNRVPKMTPKLGLKLTPHLAKNQLYSAPRRPKTVENGPRTAQDGPRPPKTAPRWP